MNIGFSGTRDGMTVLQMDRLRPMLVPGSTFHHGDCRGADEQADAIAAEQKCTRVAHPGIVAPRWRANCPTEIRHTPEHPLTRNRIIVQFSRVLIACPFEMQEQPRGGTWYTIRYAVHQVNCRTLVILPNGSLHHVTHDITTNNLIWTEVPRC